MMARALRGWIGATLWAVSCALALPSCGGAERDAIAAEAARETVSREPQHCELGSLPSVSDCGIAAVCHVCARLDGEEGVCVQPCTLGGSDCLHGQTCRPIGELRDAGGYARIGDCPAGYCR